ncbi:DUF993 family protein, partial [Pseudoclavibacter chungangensis]
ILRASTHLTPSRHARAPHPTQNAQSRQSHPRMIAGFETGRSVRHLARVFEEADRIGLFEDPELAAARATAYFRGQGIGS